MKKIFKFIALMVSILLLASCFSGKKDTYESETAGTGTEAVTDEESKSSEIPPEDADYYTLKTKNSEMILQLKEGVLSVQSLKNVSGTQYISSPSVLSLPDTGENFTFVSVEECTGDRTETGYKFTFVSDNFQFDYYITSSESYKGPFQFYGYLKNTDREDHTVNDGSYFDLEVGFQSVPAVTYFSKESGIAEGWTIYTGQDFDGTGMYTTELEPVYDSTGTNILKYESVDIGYNTSSSWNLNGCISMMYLEAGTQGLYFVHEWTSGRLKASGAADNHVLLNARLGHGTAYGVFNTNLPAGEEMLFPPVYVGVFEGDLDDGSNDYKRWFLHEKAPENLVENENEPLTQQDMQIGTDVAKYGIQSLKWDYGWWCKYKDHEGLLDVASPAYLKAIGADENTDTETVRELFKQFVQDINDSGMTFATYILLKDTNTEDIEGVPTSKGTYAHPEWFSNVNSTGAGFSADLGNTECVAFYKQYLYNFFTTYGVTTWRSDFEPICRTSNQVNRHYANKIDVQYWCTVGFSELVDYLIDNIEGFRYESCSAGGAMKDFFTATKASVINCDDSADYMSLHMSFYDSSYCFHPVQLILPVNSLTYTEGSRYYTGSGDYIYGLRTQMTAGMLLCNWDGTNSVIDETSIWETEIAEVYNKHVKPLIREGNLYHILPRPDGINWDGLLYILPEEEAESGEECGVLMLWKPAGAEHSKTVVLRGLESDAEYILTYSDHPGEDTVLKGEELMTKGLTVNFNDTEDAESDLIFITKK